MILILGNLNKVFSQEIVYLDWGYVKICYDPGSIEISNEVIRVKIHNNFREPIETEYGMVKKTIFNVEIYDKYYIIKDKIFFLSEINSQGKDKSFNKIPEKYNYSESEHYYLYKLKELLRKIN